MKIKEKYKELFLYVLFGGLTTLVNFIAFWILNKAIGEEAYLVNNAVAWFIAVVFGKLIAKLLLAVIVVILNYFFSKFIIFAKKKTEKN